MPSLIPRYALGNWWSRNTTYDTEKAMDIVSHFERRKVPLAIFLLDKDWHYRDVGETKNLHTGFTFNANLFPNPKEFIDTLHEHNVRVGLEVDPKEGIYPHEAYYQQACQSQSSPPHKTILMRRALPD